jgi:hypothetical protein
MTVLSKRELEVDLFSPKLGSDGVPMLRHCALQLAAPRLPRLLECIRR